MERYMVEADGFEYGPFDDIEEARRCARESRGRLIVHLYEWFDSELVEDYTEPEPARAGEGR